MRLDDIEEPVPESGKIRVAPTRTVLNFNEIDGCDGRYRTVNPELPYTLGMEVLGTVDAAGEGAEEWLGCRVHATAESAFGGYADKVIAQPDMVFDAPETLDDTEAAAFFFQIHEELCERLAEGRIAPLVGGTVAFEDLPAALEQMEDRLTTGRIVVVY